jgi:GH24 family phage-related lysozyme (muramidase)
LTKWGHYTTIGVGFNLNAVGARKRCERHGLNYDRLRNGEDKLDNTKATTIRDEQVEEAASITRNRLGHETFNKLDPQQQEAVVSMVFNGGGQMIGPNIKKAIREGDHKAAEDEIRFKSNKDKREGLQNRRNKEANTYSEGTKKQEEEEAKKKRKAEEEEGEDKKKKKKDEENKSDKDKADPKFEEGTDCGIAPKPKVESVLRPEPWDRTGGKDCGPVQPEILGFEGVPTKEREPCGMPTPVRGSGVGGQDSPENTCGGDGGHVSLPELSIPAPEGTAALVAKAFESLIKLGPDGEGSSKDFPLGFPK